jgi:hypothetical protein
VITAALVIVGVSSQFVLYAELFGLRWLTANWFATTLLLIVAIGFAISLVVGAIAEASRLLGAPMLASVVLGTYHRPAREQLIVMFLDIVGSARLAEEMDELRVHDLITRFFFDTDEPISDHGGAAHACVGDEVIVTWSVTADPAQCALPGFRFPQRVHHRYSDIRCRGARACLADTPGRWNSRIRMLSVPLPGSRAQAFGIDCQRKWMVAADENWPQRVRLKTPQPVIAEHTLRFEISNHRGRSHHLHRRTTIGPIQAHHPNHPGAPRVVSEHPKIAYQVTRGGGAGLPTPVIEGADLIHPLEPVVADNVERFRQIKLVRLAAAVDVHISPVISHQPIECVPQRQVIGVRHLHRDPPLD